MDIFRLILRTLMLAILTLVPSTSLAEDIPTLDISASHDFSLLEKSGFSVTPRNSKTSQSILNKKFNICLGKDKLISIGSETNKAVNSWAIFWCPPSETNIQFIALGTGYVSIEDAKKLIGQIRKAFEWDADDFEKCINESTSFHGCVKTNKSIAPYYAVEVGRSYVKDNPVFIRLTISWDVSIIEKKHPE